MQLVPRRSAEHLTFAISNGKMDKSASPFAHSSQYSSLMAGITLVSQARPQPTQRGSLSVSICAGVGWLGLVRLVFRLTS